MPNVHRRDMTFAERFRKIRTKLGLTVPEAARLLGASNRTVWAWEAGEREPKPWAMDAAIKGLARLNGTRR